METIVDKHWYRTDVFEPVTEFPFGYVVWNIGRGNFPHERCIPLCRPGYNEFAWQRNIDVDSLKYIMVETEELALRIMKEAGRREDVDRDRFYELVNVNLNPNLKCSRVQEVQEFKGSIINSKP